MLFCHLRFVHLGQQASSVFTFPMTDGDYLSKKGGNLSLQFCCRLNMVLRSSY